MSAINTADEFVPGRSGRPPGRGESSVRPRPRSSFNPRSRFHVPLIRPETDLVVRLHDGRRLGVAEFGIRSALPVLYFHGFIGSRLEPGAGGPARHQHHRLRSARLRPQRPAAPAVAAQLGCGCRPRRWCSSGVGQCMVVGVSTGAPYALAVAAALGPRVQRVILAGGIAGPEVLETAGGTALVLSLLGPARQPDRPDAAPAGEPRPGHPTGPPADGDGRGQRARGAGAAGPVAGRAACPPAASFRAGNRRGLRGALADARLVAQPWDFSVADVVAEVELLHGADDPVVPPAHAHWYAAHLPRARLHMVPGELHLSMCFRSTAPHPGGVPRAGAPARPRAPARAEPLRGSGLLRVGSAQPRPEPEEPGQSARKYSTVETTRSRLAIW